MSVTYCELLMSELCKKLLYIRKYYDIMRISEAIIRAAATVRCTSTVTANVGNCKPNA